MTSRSRYERAPDDGQRVPSNLPERLDHGAKCSALASTDGVDGVARLAGVGGKLRSAQKSAADIVNVNQIQNLLAARHSERLTGAQAVEQKGEQLAPRIAGARSCQTASA